MLNKSFVSVPISTNQFVEVVEFLRSEGSDRDPVAAIETAIEYWLENASWKGEALLPEVRRNQSRGFVWKYGKDCLFLPEGTEIRMKYNHQNYFARVDGDEIHYQGKVMTPSTLACAIGNSSRNAWISLWIKRPNDTEWTLADSHRRDRNELAASSRAHELDLSALTK